jgi:ADP-heptose:LPS heptosyltransferase
MFRLSGVPVSVIDKGRREKRDVITGKSKIRLKHTVERYCDAFKKAGLSVNLTEDRAIEPSVEALEKTNHLFENKQGIINIGVAPYARHDLKLWPEENMIRLLSMIADSCKVQFWFFGGGDETERLIRFHKMFPGSLLVTGSFNLDEELAIMSRLGFMIAMDSSNMHMAALIRIKVISIWGGTDPLIGFGAWNQPDDFAIRIPIEELTCRPCTVYGKGKCARGDFACMNWLTPEKVYQKIEKTIELL